MIVMTWKWMVRKPGLLRSLAMRLGLLPACPPEVTRAYDLIAAIDKGGVPLNPAKVNQIGRDLGLEVSSKAPVEDTIERIRQALHRS